MRITEAAESRPAARSSRMTEEGVWRESRCFIKDGLVMSKRRK